MTSTTDLTDRPAPTVLVHGHSRLALHRLRAGEGRPLLLVHGLGEQSPATVPGYLARWPGPVHALDLTGHGASTRPKGGGYTAEVLMADVDAALNHLGPATIYGRGLGGYLGLLAGGVRPDVVRGVIIADGPGLVGGGIRPTTPMVGAPHDDRLPGPDPFALLEMSRDVRPPDYVIEFVRLMNRISDVAIPISVCAIVRPEWLVAVIEEAGDRAVEGPLDEALARYADRP
jgi:pimeloyl-ACP methyl ester carboxylesterase